nr:MAG TPA: hypothetical protein [Caudoviricetes sp.]
MNLELAESLNQGEMLRFCNVNGRFEKEYVFILLQSLNLFDTIML